MAKRTFYEILGVGKTATEKEIRAAYRKLAQKHHPDKNPGDKSAETRFKEINEAYQVISNAESRKKYDEHGDNWKHSDRMAGAAADTAGRPRRAGARQWEAPPRARPNTRAGPFEGFDLFGDIFGGGRSGQNFAVPGQDIEQPVDITLEEAFHGATRTLEMPTPRGGMKRLEVKIPAGVKTGSRIRMSGEGAPGVAGAPKGDLWLVVTVRPHPSFEREGDDLAIEVPVPLVDAVLGGEIQVPTITGSKLALKVPSETQNGRVFRLRGQGMVKLPSDPARDGLRGDLLAKVRVVLPENLNVKEQELFQQLKALRGR